jgi:hypothetical protein
MPDQPLDTLESKRATLKDEILHIGELRLGSLFFRHRKCGKPTCACHQPDHPGHGGWVISKTTARGKTVMSTVPGEKLLPRVHAQLAEGQRFWRLCAEFAATSDELAKAQLRQGWAAAEATAKKKTSNRPSARKSSPKSKP